MFWAIFFAVLGGLLLGVALGKTLQKRGETQRINDAIEFAVSDAIKTERAEARRREEANLQGSHQEAARFLESHRDNPGVTWTVAELYNVRTKLTIRLLLGLGQDSPILITAILKAHPSGAEGTFFRMARLADMTTPPNLITPQRDWDIGIEQIRKGILVVPQILMFEVIPRAYRHAQSSTMKTQAGESLRAGTTSEEVPHPAPATAPATDTHAETEAPANVEVQGDTSPMTPEAKAAMAEAKAHVATTAGEFGQVFIPPADTAPAAPPVEEAPPVVEAHRPSRTTLFQGSTASEFGKSEGGGEG